MKALERANELKLIEIRMLKRIAIANSVNDTVPFDVAAELLTQIDDIKIE